MSDLEIKFKFTSQLKDPLEAIKKYTLWTKASTAINHAFPEICKHIYYKKLMLYGAQKFWETTWYERYHTVKTLGESDPLINSCWAALIRYHLDQLWPALDTQNPYHLDQLLAITRATNRIKGAKFHGLGLAIDSHNPTETMGFIDIYQDITGTNQITKWALNRFIPNKL